MKHYKIDIEENEFENILDNSLKSEPDFHFSDDFAEQLTVKLNKQNALQLYLQEFLIYLGVFMAIAGLSLAVIVWMDINLWTEIQSFILQQYVSIIGINLLLVFILFTDKVLLRYFQHRKISKQFSI